MGPPKNNGKNSNGSKVPRLSVKTQQIRHDMGHVSTAEYWKMLDSDEQEELQAKFMTPESQSHNLQM